MPLSKKLPKVEHLLLSKSPRVPKELVLEATEIPLNVYELPFIEESIRWMHEACSYHAKSTWIKAIQKGNYTGWPLLLVVNV